MRSQRNLLGWVLLLLAGAASAQSEIGGLRWRGSSLGLQPDVRALSPALVPCGGSSFSCADAASLPLYASPLGTRSLSMQLAPVDNAWVGSQAQGLKWTLVGKAGIGGEFGFYGRVGNTLNRPGSALAPLQAQGGVSYGVGLSWDFARRASAAVGLDSYDVRGATGDLRDVRTSLGMQWKY